MNSIIKFIGLAALMFAATAATSCNKDDDNGGSTSAFVGEWKSVSATGSVAFGSSELGTDVAETINNNIASYDLHDVMNFLFTEYSMFAKLDYPGLTYSSSWNYTLEDNILVFSKPPPMTYFEIFSISLHGDEFSIHCESSSTSEIEIAIGRALGEMEVRARGYESMSKAGINISRASLSVKFKKQK